MKQKNTYSAFILSASSKRIAVKASEYIRQGILETKWNVNWFTSSSYKADGQSYDLPEAAFLAIQALDKAKTGELSDLDALQLADKYLAKNSNNSHDKRIQTYRKMIRDSFVQILTNSLQSIEAELDRIHSDKRSTFYQKSSSGQRHIANLLQLRTNLYAKKNEIEKNPQAPIDCDLTALSAVVNTKTGKFATKNIMPFAEHFNQQQTEVSEATRDLGIILSAMIADTSNPTKNVFCKANPINEIEVEIKDEKGEVKKYNLTQIMRHQPDLKALNISPAELETYFSHLKSPNSSFHPGRAEALKDWTQLSSPQLSGQVNRHLTEILKVENNLSNCHAAHLLAINMYTDKYYLVMNKFLREKTFSPDMFTREALQGNPDRLGFKACEADLPKHDTGQVLDAEAMDNLVKETLMSSLIAADGLAKAKPLTYNAEAGPELTAEGSLKDAMLPVNNARTVRGAGGSWVPQVKNDYQIAYEGGTPLYLDGFSSSSFDPQKAAGFTQGRANPTITKVKAGEGATVVYVGGISSMPGEKELLIAPGSLILPRPERPIKHKEHYDIKGIDHKISNVIASGQSEKSFMYSSKINEYRGALIDLNGKLTKIEEELSSASDKTVINQMKDELRSDIELLGSQFKRIDIVLSQQPPSAAEIDNLCGKADFTYVVTAQGEMYLVDKQKKEISACPIDDLTMEQIKKDFNLTEKLEQFAASNQPMERVNQAIDIARVNYLKKFTGLDNFSSVKTEAESLSQYKDAWKKIDKSLSELPPIIGQQIRTEAAEAFKAKPVAAQENSLKMTLQQMREAEKPLDKSDEYNNSLGMK